MRRSTVPLIMVAAFCASISLLSFAMFAEEWGNELSHADRLVVLVGAVWRGCGIYFTFALFLAASVFSWVTRPARAGVES